MKLGLALAVVMATAAVALTQEGGPPVSGPAAPRVVRVSHQAPDCLLRNAFPVLDACFGEAAARTAQVVFRSGGGPWYRVRMDPSSAGSSCFSGVLPRPARTLTGNVSYFIEVSGDQLAGRSSTFEPKVVDKGSLCRGRVAKSVRKASVDVQPLDPKAPPMPSGFTATPPGPLGLSTVTLAAIGGGAVAVVAVGAALAGGGGDNVPAPISGTTPPTTGPAPPPTPAQVLTGHWSGDHTTFIRDPQTFTCTFKGNFDMDLTGSGGSVNGTLKAFATQLGPGPNDRECSNVLSREVLNSVIAGTAFTSGSGVSFTVSGGGVTVTGTATGNSMRGNFSGFTSARGFEGYPISPDSSFNATKK